MAASRTIVPIQVTSIIVPNALVTKGAIADYSRLPYSTTEQDFHPESPYIAETILDPPFQDKNSLLEPGVHIHWHLPAVLTRPIPMGWLDISDLDRLGAYFASEENTASSNWMEVRARLWNFLLNTNCIAEIRDRRASILGTQDIDQTGFDSGIATFAAESSWDEKTTESFVQDLISLFRSTNNQHYLGVPDLWLIRRKTNDELTGTWVVESSFVSTTRSSRIGNRKAVTIPYHDDRSDNKTIPFRFLGRSNKATDSWPVQESPEVYLRELTSIGYNEESGSKGYGEPTFSRYYPNSRSVFGFHDPDLPESEGQISYEVLGVYSNSKNDFLELFFRDFENRFSDEPEKLPAKLPAALLDDFGLDISSGNDESPSLPGRMVLFGTTRPVYSDVPSGEHIRVSVGNTGTEALSGYLAGAISGEKAKVEDLLEAIQFSSLLRNNTLDIGYKFHEARQAKGFDAVEGGTVWLIKRETSNDDSASEVNEADLQQGTLHDELAVLLNETNTLQFAYDKAAKDIPALRRQLFSDWHRYMVNAYPPIEEKDEYFDIDRLKAYIEEESIKPLKARLTQTSTISISLDESGAFKRAISKGANGSLAGHLAAKLQEIASAIDLYNSDTAQKLTLRPVAAPRYYRASDPVVLFTEDYSHGENAHLGMAKNVAEQSKRPIRCRVIPGETTEQEDIDFGEAMNLCEKALAFLREVDVQENLTTSPAWSPFMMDWEAELVPPRPGSNLDSPEREYDPEFINRHYRLDETECDFTFHSDDSVFESASLYQGSTVLTPYAGPHLASEIERFLEQHGEDQTPETRQLLQKSKQKLEQLNVLSQSLGGFYEGLRTQKQTRQLDAADPLGFPAYQEFADQIASLVGKQNLTAPTPLADFLPISGGLFRILSLRLIDTFGRTLDVDDPEITPSESLRSDSSITAASLPPRLAQSARLNFRLLSATSGEEEMSAHPASSPVCGWLMPNRLDRSIMFYDQSGESLGALTLNSENPWTPAPDSSKTTFIEAIPNPHLRRVARQLFDRQVDSLAELNSTDGSFLDHFFTAIDNAQESIDPENFAEHQDLAILMGEPIAVIRATLGIELEAPPSLDQSWTQLWREIHGHGRSSHGFTKIKFPIRLGEYNQLNDGLVGYWRETVPGRELGEDYFSSEAGENPDPHIRTYVPGDTPSNIFQSISDSPATFTILADPKGVIKATSGILPVKSASIPKDQYLPALRRIAVTFLTSPVLANQDHLRISLPREPGYEWTWLEKNSHRQWEEIPQSPLVTRELFQSMFPDQAGLWDHLVQLNWLEPLDGEPERARITSQVRRAFPPGEDTGDVSFPSDLAKRIDNFFDTCGRRIEPFDWHATFLGPLSIREGWLRLEKTTETISPPTSPNEPLTF